MPLSEIHDKKKTKNRVMLVAILGWIALIWVITMVKMAVNGG